MIETYAQEVIRKRRASRVFWSIVFFSTVMLYFFFQGYYPAINFSFRSLTSGSGVSSEPGDLIRSFGIINVAVIPGDAEILLGSGEYSSDEKRMTSYGDYALSMKKPGYLDAHARFTINRETPYYIEIMTLIENPIYRRLPSFLTDISRLDDEKWSGQTASGIVFLTADFTQSGTISERLYTPIGEGYFLSGATLMRYDTKKELWERQTWSGSSSFIADCPENIRVRQGYLSCPEEEKILTQNGKTLTGIISIGRNYLRQSDGIIRGEKFSKLLLTPVERKNTLFFSYDDVWYTSSGSSLEPLENQRGEPISIETGLKTIKHIEILDSMLLAFGESTSGTLLSFIDLSKKRQTSQIPFPDIPLEDMKIVKYEGNLFIKTRGALLLNYHNDERIHWLVEGEILAYNTGAALYRKDSELWRADWNSSTE